MAAAVAAAGAAAGMVAAVAVAVASPAAKSRSSSSPCMALAPSSGTHELLQHENTIVAQCFLASPRPDSDSKRGGAMQAVSAG